MGDLPLKWCSSWLHFDSRRDPSKPWESTRDFRVRPLRDWDELEEAEYRIRESFFDKKRK